jgi:hypothetical protein
MTQGREVVAAGESRVNPLGVPGAVAGASHERPTFRFTHRRTAGVASRGSEPHPVLEALPVAVAEAWGGLAMAVGVPFAGVEEYVRQGAVTGRRVPLTIGIIMGATPVRRSVSFAGPRRTETLRSINSPSR